MSDMENNLAQMEIETSSELLPFIEKIADSMPGGFFIYHADSDEKLIYYNQAMLRLFGCETKEEFEELTHNSFKGIVHPDDLDQVEKSIVEQIAQDKYDMDYVEYRIIQKDGTIRWIEDYGHFAHSALYGDVFYVFVGDATDRLEKRMTDLEEINEELRNAYDRESQYRKAIIKNAVSFFEVNLSRDRFLALTSQIAGFHQGRAVEFGSITPVTKYSKYVEMWAHKVNEEERAAYKKFFDKDRLIRCYHKGEPEQVFEVWSTDIMGRRRMVRYTVLLGKQEYTGDVIALSTCTDITDQTERQNLLQIALTQAQSGNVAISAFLANMSHDIRTPLNVIRGCADLLLERCEDPKTRDYIMKIREAGSEMLTIVKEAMEMTWAESGKAVLAETDCNVDELIGDVAESVEPMMKKKHLSFHVNGEDVWHKFIYADTIRLKEILGQLLDNALKYTNEGGEVWLTVREEYCAPDGYAQLSFIVRDTGIGISEELVDDLLQAFSKERNTTKSKVLDSGLGLTVVRTFLDMMDGTLHVESQVGEGSTFTVKALFKLSQESGKDGKESVKALDRLMLVGKRILLVEDNELNAEITEELLTQSGFVVETAENGQVAVEKVAGSKPGYYCAVLMDIQMPVMDGYEAADRIRKLGDSELANIPIVALTAKVLPEDQQRFFHCGMDAHFAKPIEIDSLIDLLCRVLAKE